MPYQGIPPGLPCPGGGEAAAALRGGGEGGRGGYFGASVSPSISSFSLSSCHQAALSGSNFLSPSLGADGGSGDSWGSGKQRRGGGGGTKAKPPSVCPSVPWRGPWYITCFLPGDRRGQSRSRRREKLRGTIRIRCWAWGRQSIFTAQLLPRSGTDKASAGGSWEFLRPTLLLLVGSGLAKGIHLSGNGGISSFRAQGTGSGRVRRKDGAMHEAKCCHGAPVPALARGLRRRPGGGGLRRLLQAPVNHRPPDPVAFQAHPPALGFPTGFWGEIALSPCFTRLGKLRHGQALLGNSPPSCSRLSGLPQTLGPPHHPGRPRCPVGRLEPPVPGDTGGGCVCVRSGGARPMPCEGLRSPPGTRSFAPLPVPE